MAYTERHLSHEKRKEVWPNKKRIAVQFYVAAEEYIWKDTTEVPDILSRGEKPPTLSVQTAIKHGFEFGIPRLLKVLDSNGVKASFFLNGLAAERHPETTREIQRHGHEIVGHSYSQETHLGKLDRESQRKTIRATLDAIEKVTSKRPTGWDCPFASCTPDTIELLIEEGLKYDADFQDDELPYFIDYDGKSLVELPHQRVYAVNDFGLFARDVKAPPEKLAEAMKATFDIYYREATTTPIMWRFGVHPFLGGKPEGAYVVDSVLRYVKNHDEVWIPTLDEMADWWISKFGGDR